jgi:hypothetical protein
MTSSSSSSIDIQWRCRCLSCHRTFIITSVAPPSVIVCVGCKQKFGSVERTHDYNFPYGTYEKYKKKKDDKLADTYLKSLTQRYRDAYDYEVGFSNRYKHKKRKSDKLADTHFEKAAEYCIVPWVRNPQPKIIPDATFHLWYEDMKARMKLE